MGYGKKAARIIDVQLMGVDRWHELFPQFEYDQSPPEPSVRRAPSLGPAPLPVNARTGVHPRVTSDAFAEVVCALDCRRSSRGGVSLPALRREGGEHVIKGDNSCHRRKYRFESMANWSVLVEGQTILQAARASGKYIPTLCYLEGLSAVGACRLCIVEVSGVGRLLPACTTPVQDGMSVTTNSPQAGALSEDHRWNCCSVERNHVCAVCVSNGHCELQSMAYALGVNSVRFPYNYPKLSVDMSHERYVLDHNRCILCTRCVRVCARDGRSACVGNHRHAASTRAWSAI